MLLKILLQVFTLYLFAGGYVLTFIIMIILKFPIFNSLWIGFIGGISLCGIWGFFIQLLTLLLSEKELATLFGFPMPEGIADIFNDDDDDDLTLSDLYNPDDGDPIDDDDEDLNDDDFPENTTNVADDTPFSDAFLPLDIDDLDSSEEATISSNLDADGKFKITASGKTLKASPQDGAQAVRKVLNESESVSESEY